MIASVMVMIQNKTWGGGAKQKQQCLSWPSIIYTPSLVPYFIDHTKKPWYSEGKIAQGCDTKRWGSLSAISEADHYGYQYINWKWVIQKENWIKYFSTPAITIWLLLLLKKNKTPNEWAKLWIWVLLGWEIYEQHQDGSLAQGYGGPCIISRFCSSPSWA